MDQEKENIPSPFQAPDGYFDGFEARLEARMSPAKGGNNLKVQHKQLEEFTPRPGKARPILEWVAVAATVAVLAVSGYMFYLKLTPTVPDAMPVASQPVPRPSQEVTKVQTEPAPEEIENMVVAVMLEEAEQQNSTVKAERALTRKETATAVELEDAGLIVMETNDGLFDQFEL